MISPKGRALRVFARQAGKPRARPSQQPALKQQYSSATGTAKETVKKASSDIPWALSAFLVTTGGTWLALQPRDAGHHDEHHDEHHAEEEGSDEGEAGEEEGKPEKHTIQEKLDEKKEALKDEIANAKAVLPKPERDGNSVENHAKAAETNEHKIRTGKFSKEAFDNHDTRHTEDPAKDFEKIEKQEADS